jgi:PBSX family phage portal protein
VTDAKPVQKIDVSLGRGIGNRRSLVPQETDVFKAKGEDLRKFTNLTDAVKKRIYRQLQKEAGAGYGRYDGVDRSNGYHGGNGSGSKMLDPMQSVSIDAYNIFGAVVPPYNLDYLAKLFELSAPHYAAVRAKVSNIVALGYGFTVSPQTTKKLNQTKSDRTKKSLMQAIDDESQALMDWLDECNDQDEFIETLQKVWTDYETTGNGYFEVGRDLQGRVAYIGHIPAQTMRVRIHRDGYVQVVANQVVFFRNLGDKKTVDMLCGDPNPNEVIHIKKYSPTNTFYGVPDIIAAQQAVAGNEFSARFNLDYFENKAVPRYVIVLKGANFSAQAESNLLEFFETGLKGQNHRTLFVPLPANDSQQEVEFKMEPVEAGLQDSSFNNYRRGNLEEILMAHRVPISKVTMPDGMQLATARDADKTFKEQVCRPEQDMLEKKLNKIIKELTDIVVLKLNELTLTDEDTQSQIDQRYAMIQAVTPNEIRRTKGLGPIAGGDTPYDPKPQQSSDQTNNAKGQDARAQQRSAAATDSKGEGRNAKGDGPKAP